MYEIAQTKICDGIEWLADRGDGLPFNVMSLKYAWIAEIEEDAIPFANLRNSWRTFAQYDRGIDFDTLEFLMGHIPPGVSGKHYLRPTVENLVNAVAKAMVQSQVT